MPTTSDLDRYELTANDLAAMTRAREGVKLVHNLTDRGIIPFRKEGRSRLYSFGSLVTLDVMIRARGVGLGLSEGAKLAEVVVARAKEQMDDLYIRLEDMRAWHWLIYAFDRDIDPPALQSYIVNQDERITDLEITLSSGWHADVTSLFPIDRVIWECADTFDRKMKERREK